MGDQFCVSLMPPPELLSTIPMAGIP